MPCQQVSFCLVSVINNTLEVHTTGRGGAVYITGACCWNGSHFFSVVARMGRDFRGGFQRLDRLRYVIMIWSLSDHCPSTEILNRKLYTRRRMHIDECKIKMRVKIHHLDIWLGLHFWSLVYGWGAIPSRGLAEDFETQWHTPTIVYTPIAPPPVPGVLTTLTFKTEAVEPLVLGEDAVAVLVAEL